MAQLIQTTNCLTAWRDASSYILDNGNGANLLVEISQPLGYTDSELTEIYNSNLISEKTVKDVVNTIFPHKFYSRSTNLTLNEFYDLHEKIYHKGKSKTKNKSRWGNYFLRMTKFGSRKQNQLQKIIDSINSRPKKYAACYIIHTSSIDEDNNTKPIGNPCLQYIQFEQQENTINLTAVYRNHDFLKKALGNYIGLARLLEFLCNQTNHQLGTVTCHSIHYFLDKKTDVRKCIGSLNW